MWNVPDDWNSYYRRCPRCGSRYHASEGGCDCHEDQEPCSCGSCNWDDWTDEDPRCSDCGTGPHVDNGSRTTTHVARRDHGKLIRKGDTYRRTVHFGYYPDGPRTLRVAKRLVAKGPAWDGGDD